MKLYLSSFKIGNKTEELKNWAIENDNKICLIPNAMDGFPKSKKLLRIQEAIKELEEIGFEVTIISLEDYFNQKEKLREDLEEFYAFYVLGGNVFTLRQSMYLSGFDQYLKEISTNPNYLYAGYSAGICVLAKNLQGLQTVDNPNENRYNYNRIIWEGIGLIDYLPMPHYKSDHPESIMIDKEIEFCVKNNIKYKTIKDGDVLIENIYA